MECACSISIDEGNLPACTTHKIRTARKQHTCTECNKIITPGEKYEYYSGIWDGTPEVFKTCINCKSIREVFFNSWCFTKIWEDFTEGFGGFDVIIPESCLAALTPGARARICEFIEASWEVE